MDKKFIFPKGGSLIFWGDIFGGRYGENYHRIVDSEYDKAQGIFRLQFNESETCTVYKPINISFSETAFVIEDASLIIWEWYYYGRTKKVGNLMRYEYEKIDASTVLKKEAARRTKLVRGNQCALKFL